MPNDAVKTNRTDSKAKMGIHRIHFVPQKKMDGFLFTPEN